MKSDQYATDRFAGWLSDMIAPVMRQHQFKKTASTFHRRGPEGWGVVNFQKSPWGTRHAVQFYINIGVALDALILLDGRDPAKPPPENWCTWRSRIEDIAPDARPWFDFDASTDLADLTQEVVGLVTESALPWIDARISTAGTLAAIHAGLKPGEIWPRVEVVMSALGRAPARDIPQR